jgi:hypothetical protein
MRRAALATLACAAPFAAVAADDAPKVSDEGAPKISAAINGSYYAMRDEPDFGVVVASVNRGPLRFEARHNYEARHATSAFIGWKFAGGEDVTYDVTPIAGALFGAAHGGIAGVEASVAWRSFDAYVEAEYVDDRNDHSNRYVYAWSELGFRPLEWLRFGIVGQRTHVVHTDRDLQRGPFVQLIFRSVSVGVYAFNPDAGSRYTVVSVAASF